MAAVRMTRVFLRRAAAVMTLIGAALPAAAGGWSDLFLPPAAASGRDFAPSAPPVPGLRLGVAWGSAAAGAAPGEAVPQVRAGYGTRSLLGYMAFSAPEGLLDRPGSETGDIGIGVIFAPNRVIELQGEIQHREPADSGTGSWQDRLKLSASFRF